MEKGNDETMIGNNFYLILKIKKLEIQTMTYD
jgi:hypothetical protein